MRSAIASLFLAAWCGPACAQNLQQSLDRAANLMDGAVLRIHDASRSGVEKPVDQLDQAIRNQREVLGIIDELLKEVAKAPGCPPGCQHGSG